jgi:hypothetical protein
MPETKVTEGGGVDSASEIVRITINNVEYPVRRGRHTVAELKEIGHVPLADELEEKVDGTLRPLPDNGSVEIKGGEVFVSHPRSGGSS